MRNMIVLFLSAHTFVFPLTLVQTLVVEKSWLITDPTVELWGDYPTPPKKNTSSLPYTR